MKRLKLDRSPRRESDPQLLAERPGAASLESRALEFPLASIEICDTEAKVVRRSSRESRFVGPWISRVEVEARGPRLKPTPGDGNARRSRDLDHAKSCDEGVDEHVFFVRGDVKADVVDLDLPLSQQPRSELLMG